MKKKIVAFLMAVSMCMVCIWGGNIETYAEDVEEDIDFSYLLTDDALVGYAESQTWGTYLVIGRSIINKISDTKIGAGGTTTAATYCKVSITSIVEKKTDSGWVRVTSWTQTNTYDISAMISKSLTVGSGYYYRVRSLHYASTDSSSSMTSNLWM